MSRLLTIADNGWRVKDVTAVLRSGIVNLEGWSLTPEDVDLLSQQGREQQIWSGREKVEALSESLKDDLRRAILGIGALLDGLASDASERETLLLDALFGENGWLQDPRNLDDETAQSLSKLRDYLSEMARARRDTDDDVSETYEAFLERLNRRLSVPVLMRRTPGGVLLAPMHTMHGLRFRHVVVGGLSEGEFPASHRSGELLTENMARFSSGCRSANPASPALNRTGAMGLRDVSSRQRNGFVAVSHQREWETGAGCVGIRAGCDGK